MNSKQGLSYAIALALAAPGARVARADSSAEAPTSTEISEIVVTAQRRAESIQNVPITIQALTTETISQLNVTTFEDFVKYLPNVTASGVVPGKAISICGAFDGGR